MRRRLFTSALSAAALFGCGPASTSSDGGPDSSINGGGGFGGGVGFAGTTGPGTGGTGDVCGAGAPAQLGFAGGSGSTTWCADDGGAPDDAGAPDGGASDGGTGTLSLIAGVIGGPGQADGVGPAARFRGLRGLGFEGGKLYVVDRENLSIRQVDVATGAVTTLAGNRYDFPTMGPNPLPPCSVDGAGKAARFSDPVDVVGAGDDSVYVSDQSAHVIRRVVVASGAVTTLAGAPGVPGTSDGRGAAARFNRPGALASDGAGHVYVADTFSSTIREVDVKTGAVRTLAGAPLVGGACDGVGAKARFGRITDLTSDGAGHLYVADGYLIRKVDVATGAVTTEFGTQLNRGEETHLFRDLRTIVFDREGSLYVTSSGAPARVDIATGRVTGLQGWKATELASDGAGNLYFLDPNGAGRQAQIFKVATVSGQVTLLAGSVISAGSDDGKGTDARFSNPLGVASDGAGNIYVVDYKTIRMIAAGTDVVTTLAGNPLQPGIADGVGGDARFGSLFGAAAESDGSAIYVGDLSGGAIRKVVVGTRAVTTLAGSLGKPGFADGVGAAAEFASPSRLTLDRHGNLFVVDERTIRKVVVATGAVTTLASTYGTSGMTDGVGAAARFGDPRDIASDGEGTLYVTDRGAVRKIDVATATVSTFLDVDGGPIGADGKGGLYLGTGSNVASTIARVDLATKSMITVVGTPGFDETRLGPLPAAVRATGVSLLPNGDLVISVLDNAVVRARF